MKLLLAATMLFIAPSVFCQTTANYESVKAENTRLIKSAASLKAANTQLADSVLYFSKAKIVLADTVQSLHLQKEALETALAAATKQNDYFRETLKILEAKIKTVSFSKIDFTLLSCVGEGQVVTLQLLLVNHDVNKTIMFSMPDAAMAIDLQGNAYKFNTIRFSEKSWSTQLNTDIATKLTITFAGVLPTTMLLKSISLKGIINTTLMPSEVSFKDITINWN